MTMETGWWDEHRKSVEQLQGREAERCAAVGQGFGEPVEQGLGFVLGPREAF